MKIMTNDQKIDLEMQCMKHIVGGRTAKKARVIVCRISDHAWRCYALLHDCRLLVGVFGKHHNYDCYRLCIEQFFYILK
jgi:hypothetical protein